MAEWIRVINELPIVEVKPDGSNGFSDDQLMMLIGTDDPEIMFPGDDGLTALFFNDESTDPVNERVAPC